MVDFRDNPTFGLPSFLLNLVKANNAGNDPTWYQFFTRLAQLSAERPIEAISVGASPFTYTARTIGHVFVENGTVALITLERSGATVECPTRTFIPVAANDTVTVDYSGLPDMTFVPSARA